MIAFHGFENHDPGSVQRAIVRQLDPAQSFEHSEAAQEMRKFVRVSGIAPAKIVILPLATGTAETIRRVAEREQADLIVIGTQGRSGFEKFVLGSVARDLAGNSAIDVLVASNTQT